MVKLKMFAFKLILSISFLTTIIQCAPMTKEDGMEYLQKYGYMLNDTSDEAFKKSIEEFQETFSLPITGKLDFKTIAQMELPRCGHPDRLEIRNNRVIWNKRRLTYKFVNYPLNGLSADVARREIQRAFRVWSERVPLDFEERPEGSNVDIDITFNRNGDGPGKTLAYAYFPRRGDVYFDNEQWTSNSERGFSLFLVAAHEIGHSLGLEHSMVRQALLYPYIPRYTPNFSLHGDDISRIQGLYGRRQATTNNVPTNNNVPRTRPNVCTTNRRINTVFFKNGMIYIVRGRSVFKMNRLMRLQAGYPKELNEEWKDAPESVDAMYSYKNDIYFQKGQDVYKFDGEMRKTNSDNELITDIDDAVTYGQRTYVFKGPQYYRYDNMKKVPGYPRDISTYWTNIPNNIDAVYYEDTKPNKYFYFFKDDMVYKFDMDNRQMIREMPLREYLRC